MNIVELLVYLQIKGFYKIPHVILAFLGLEIPKSVVFSDRPGGGYNLFTEPLELYSIQILR